MIENWFNWFFGKDLAAIIISILVILIGALLVYGLAIIKWPHSE